MKNTNLLYGLASAKNKRRAKNYLPDETSAGSNSIHKEYLDKPARLLIRFVIGICI